jgi:enamine deaminase RidA (YjgF/YER057c/UK114 family)
MDPDDAEYLPAVLQGSGLVRGHDLFVRSRSTSMPRNVARPQPFSGGASPLVDDYQEALDRLEQAEEVDLVIASVDNQLDDAGIKAAQQAVVAHCTKMADVARNRIGLGSVTASESPSVNAILDHADDVRSDHFILAAPAGAAAAVAGLLSLQDYFQSPTYKTVPSLGVPAGAYTDANLNQLVGGNVLVVNEKRKLGIIVVKGVLTSGRQINVQRTANKAVRDVKAIADVYIGLLNNQGTRNALRQQITALFLQMERDGAIVPSTDGKDPSFKVDVYSTEADFANGIVRIDIAIRPVRAIDFIYATILVQN